MVSLARKFTNLVFRLMPHDKEGEVHDYVAERKRMISDHQDFPRA